MKTIFNAGLCGIAAALLTASSSLAMLAVDFNSGGSPTQSGFMGVGAGGATGITGTGIGSSIDISFGTNSTTGVISRDRGTPSVSPTALTQDFVFAASGSPANGTYLDLIISGVDAGSYTFTGYFHDADPQPRNRDAKMDISVDNSTGFVLKLDDLQRSDPSVGSPTLGIGSFTFDAIDGEDITVRIVADTNGHLINGFTLAAVPEAGAFLVWSMLSGVAVVRYRGKRRPA